jgi:DNA-binding beta-propeller fold protein YncE
VRPLRSIYVGLLLASLVVSLAALGPLGQSSSPAEAGPVAPAYRVDWDWPKPLPNQWLVGQVAGIAVDKQDHIWLIQRPSTLTADEMGAELSPPRSECCKRAPPVMEFDSDGNMLRAWGFVANVTPTPCAPPANVTPIVGGSCYEFPVNEHGIFVDDLGNVWIGGNGGSDHQVLKFSASGSFLMQIGRAGVTGGDADTQHLGRPADIFVDTAASEVYISDGYLNHRVIVFDSETGAYKRHWGANGKPPGDASVPKQFMNPVHCVVIADDGLVYVCDRVNNRVQVFQKNGTYVKEFYVRDAPVKTLGNGSTWDVDFSRDKRQTYLFNADGENNKVWTLLRDSGEILGAFGRNGRNAGQFHWVHNLATDSRGAIYTAEVDTGKRAQKFVQFGNRPIP